MKSNDNEDIKVIKFGQNNNNNEDQKQNMKSEMKTENPNENKAFPIVKKTSKLKAQRTKAPKVYMQNLKKEKGGFSSLFSCCLPSGKDDDGDDE